MDNAEIFRNYCSDRGVPTDDFVEGAPLELTLAGDVAVTVVVTAASVRLQAMVGSVADFSEKHLEHALREPLTVRQEPLNACPVLFSVPAEGEEMVITGERAALASVEELDRMISAFVSIRDHYAALAGS